MRRLKHVLIVDDDEVNNFICENIIKKAQFSETVSSFSNPRECLSYLNDLEEGSKDIPELIFLDLNMPILNGWEYLSEFSKLEKPFCKDISFIILSSTIYQEDIKKSLEIERVLDFISKPLTKSILKELNERHFNNLA